MPESMTDLEPTRTAVSVALYNERREFLIVLRPDDEPDDDIAGMWGLPAIAGPPGAHLSNGRLAETARQIGPSKLGVTLEVGRRVGESTHERPWGILRLVLFEAALVSGEPATPQMDTSVTQYVDCKFTADESLLFEAARSGSQCTQIFLDDRRIDWRSEELGRNRRKR